MIKSYRFCAYSFCYINLTHKPDRKPNCITKADREARKSDDLLKRDFSADKPLETFLYNFLV